MTRTGVIDRFEGDWAVIQLSDEQETRNIPRKVLPRRAKEGDYLLLEMENEQIIHVQIDSEATEKARKRIQDKLDRLRRGDHLHND